MELINLTPHTINVLLADGQEVSFHPSGGVARCAVMSVDAFGINGIPVRKQTFGEVEGIPTPKDGVTYLTSTLVAQRANRTDVVSPDTGPTAIREGGQVKAVTAFQAF